MRPGHAEVDLFIDSDCEDVGTNVMIIPVEKNGSRTVELLVCGTREMRKTLTNDDLLEIINGAQALLGWVSK